MQVTERVST